MIREIVLPQLAMGNSEGTIVEWLVPEGGQVNRDEPLLSIETEKVVTELPSPYQGFLHIVQEVDATVPVETLIAQIAGSEEEYRQLFEAETNGSVVTESPSENAAARIPAATSSEKTVDSSLPKGRIKVSGLARKMAGIEGLDLTAVNGTGPGGRIVRRDVEAAIQARDTAGLRLAHEDARQTTGRRALERIPLTGMRGTVAERMMQAKLNTAQTYVFFEIDVTKLLQARATMVDREGELGTRISLVSLYTKALATACQHVPICNATVEGDEITIWNNVDVSVAVAMPGKGENDSGLLVPVLRDVESKSVLQISLELKDLVSRARAGKLEAGDMSDHTVTLSSTGGLTTPGSWLVSAPILNMPAVLAFQPGTPKRTPVVNDEDQVIIRDILPCGLTFDHRAVDGGPVGDFTRKITDLLSNPELMLL